MIKPIFSLILLIIFAKSIFGQNQQQAISVLNLLENNEDYETIKLIYNDWKIHKSYTLGIDSTADSVINNAIIGSKFLRQYDNGKFNVAFKITSRKTEVVTKVKYIFFDGNKISKKEIDSIRPILIKNYRNGTDFTALVTKYSMDQNPTGDLDWFRRGVMIREFEDAVFPREQNEIFTVDINSKNWYYIVLKTNPTIETTITETIGIQYFIK